MKKAIQKTGTTLSPNIAKSVNFYIPIPQFKITEVYDSYWKFAAKRQEIFFNRIDGQQYPWSNDSVLNTYKFTNVYRASDRVSQYLIKNVIYEDSFPMNSKEILFRILLFKLFNKIETWELLSSHFGPITLEDYNFKHYDDLLSKTINSGKRIYSAAYIMPSGKSFFKQHRKHSNHLKLIELILKRDTDELLASSKRMQNAFELIKSFPSLGDFLAYQLTIDINYSPITNFSESEFVVPGPGALGGISKCFTNSIGLNNVEIIKLMADRQEHEFERLELEFKTLWGRRLQLIDCQNLFCEIDKYSRVAHPEIKGKSERTKIKQKFRSTANPINYWFPPKWGINERIIK